MESICLFGEKPEATINEDTVDKRLQQKTKIEEKAKTEQNMLFGYLFSFSLSSYYI